MNSGKQITIVGGGLAGLALGISLRQQRVPVATIEARSYPRHSVCGEFICGRGIEVLRELGLYEQLRAAGAVEARTICLFLRRDRRLDLALPTPALCLPRHTLDTVLARRFESAGGDLRINTRHQGSYEREGFVRAAGRRRAQPTARLRWFGIKAHFTRVQLQSDLEMHLVPGGYVGLCRHGDGTVNACGLLRCHKANPHTGRELVPDLLKGPGHSELRRTMASGQLVPGSFCAVAGLDLAPAEAASTSECRIGDALTMIPPLTGNGMSMALESAAIAMKPLAAFSQGIVGWSVAQRAIAHACDHAFRTRLRWARVLHAAIFASFQAPLAALAMRYPAIAQTFYARTR